MISLSTHTDFHGRFILRGVSAEVFSVYGFYFLMVLLVSIGLQQFYPNFFFKSIANVCATHLKDYNITHVADCSKFTSGSLAEQCAIRPEGFNMKLTQCVDFIK